MLLSVRHNCDLQLLLKYMHKFESSQKDESRTKQADSSEISPGIEFVLSMT